VLLLVGLEEEAHETAAILLNLPVGTVRSRLSRSRDLLRKLTGDAARPGGRRPRRRDVTAG
jgi:DNA-directed RNA polymerase specialized sigma24 family protein